MTRAPYAHGFSVKPFDDAANGSRAIGHANSRRDPELSGAKRRLVEARRLFAACAPAG